jgi:dihydrofolate reductase
MFNRGPNAALRFIEFARRRVLAMSPRGESGLTGMSERNVILKMVLSLDGFATSLDGTHEWMFEWFDEESRERNLRALEEAGVHAMGRRSYEIMGPHWAASEGPIAAAMNDKPKAVFSRTLQKADWGPAEIFGEDLRAGIADLKCRDDIGSILVHGGPGFAASLTRTGLVDEYQFSTVPIAIGAGRSPFAELDEHVKLEVVDEQRFRSGALAQVLVPKR